MSRAIDPWRRSLRGTRWRDLGSLCIVLGALATGAALVCASGLRWQRTASLPAGIYRDVLGAPITRGALGVWCLPAASARRALARGYIGVGHCAGGTQPIGKVVLAVAGDTIDLTADGLRLNGRPVAGTHPLTRDVWGRSMSPPLGRYVLARGQLWLWSPYSSRSFDSRYFGPVPSTSLVAVVRPVWTWR